MVKIEEIKPAVKTELDEQKQDLFIQYNFSYCFSVSRNLQLNFKKLCFDFFLLNIFFLGPEPDSNGAKVDTDSDRPSDACKSYGTEFRRVRRQPCPPAAYCKKGANFHLLL